MPDQNFFEAKAQQFVAKSGLVTNDSNSNGNFSGQRVSAEVSIGTAIEGLKLAERQKVRAKRNIWNIHRSMHEGNKKLSLIDTDIVGLEKQRRFKKAKYGVSDVEINSSLNPEIKAEQVTTERESRSRLMSENNLGNVSSQNLRPTKATINFTVPGGFTSQKINLLKSQKSGFGKYNGLELQDLKPNSVDPEKKDPKKNFFETNPDSGGRYQSPGLGRLLDNVYLENNQIGEIEEIMRELDKKYVEQNRVELGSMHCDGQ